MCVCVFACCSSVCLSHITQTQTVSLIASPSPVQSWSIPLDLYESVPLPSQDAEPPAPPLPPDGGWGWVVVVGSLLVNIIVDGICFSFGCFLLPLMDEFGESRGKTAFVGALIPTLYLGVGEYFLLPTSTRC